MPHTRTSIRRSPRLSKSPKKQSKSTAVPKFLSTLFNSREQAHILHLQTSSYASHKALQKYYQDIIDLIDNYIETYQGKYGIVKGYKPSNQYVEGNKNIIPYFKNLEKIINNYKSQLPQDLDLENIYADILGLIHRTLYMLTQLH